MKKTVITLVIGAIMSTWALNIVVPAVKEYSEVTTESDIIMNGYPRSEEEWD